MGIQDNGERPVRIDFFGFLLWMTMKTAMGINALLPFLYFRYFADYTAILSCCGLSTKSVPDIVVDGHNVLGRPLTGTRIVPMFVRPKVIGMNIVVIEWPYPYRASTGNVAIIETIERLDIFGTLKDAYKGFCLCRKKNFHISVYLECCGQDRIIRILG